MPEKRHYILIERLGEGPKINGYDCWLTDWENRLRPLLNVLEESPLGGIAVRLTVMCLTDQQRDRVAAQYGCDSD